MKGGDSMRDYNKECRERRYDQTTLYVPKGQLKAVKAKAYSEHKSINGVINELLQAYMDMNREEWQNPKSA